MTVSKWVNTPESSNVGGIGFDDDSHEIIVQFKNGTMYAYDPAKTIFESFCQADSKGSFVHKVLKAGGISYRRLDTDL